ncbi:MAG: transglycosylase domain-containing protein [Rickettsiales bacterium]|nr:transglycosylase domain-containing protein [Rickettsiales bacterium]
MAFVLFVILPVLALFVSPPSTLMLGRWMTGQRVERHAVPLARMGRFIPQMVLVAEDARFCLHSGVDWQEMSKVINDTSGPRRGASTLPMQTAKNLYLWPGRSYVRKALEIPLAYGLSALWSKRRMLEIYLNMAEWGEGIFGVEAAAQHYFHTSSDRLTRQQVAQLITALPDPLHRNAAKPTHRHLALARALMARVGREPHVMKCIERRE